MSDSNASEKRRRGVLLSFQGWQRLQSAEQLAAVQQNDGNPFILEQLNTITGLSPNTLTKVRRRQKPVDFTTLETYFRAFDLELEPTDVIAPEAQAPSLQPLSEQNHAPRGALPMGSPFYTFRPPVERLCFQEILAPGALLRIKAPHQFGKTSLITQILGYAQDQGLYSTVINLQMLERQILESSDSFLRCFCASIARALGLPNELKSYWDNTFGAGYSCTDYFESYLLRNCDAPLLLIIDDFDELFLYTDVITDFCGLLRSWYELGRYGANAEIWQRLRIVIAHSMEVELPLNLNQSPFNVGLSVHLSGFEIYQVQEIASRYELDFSEIDAEALRGLVGGHPYLTQLSLFHLSQGIELELLLDSAIALDGIFSSHLHRQLQLLESVDTMPDIMAKVIQAPQGVKLHPKEAFYLRGLGLVRFESQHTVSSCELYRRFFATVLET